MNFKSIEDQMLGIVCSVFDAYSAVLFLPEEDGERHYLAASFSLGDNIPKNVTVLPGKGLVGYIILNHKPLVVPDVDKRQSHLGYYHSESEAGIKAFMGFPIPTGGAICVDSKRQYSFSERDYKLLQLFADLIARQQSLTQADISGNIPRYFAELGVIQDLRFRYKRWAAFLQNFLRTISDATEFDYCAFATRHEDDDEYCLESESAPLLLTNGRELRLPLGSGITGWVFRNEQPVFAEGGGVSPASALFGKLPEMPDFSSAICLPVIISKACRGVLCLANTDPKPIDESLRGFLRQAVDHLGLFLENIYLKNRLKNLLPKANFERHGGRVYNPDTAPLPVKNEGGDEE